MNRALFIIIPLSLFLAVIQSAFFARITFLGHIPQLLVLLVVSWTMLRDLTEGFVWALIAGLALDLFSAGPLGTSAIAMMAAAAFAYAMRQVLPRGQFLIPGLLGALCAVLYLATSLLLTRLGGYSTSADIFAQLISFIVLHGLLMLPIYWLMVWLVGVLFPEPIDG